MVESRQLPCSSMVEQLAVNQLVVGSSPTGGAVGINQLVVGFPPPLIKIKADPPKSRFIGMEAGNPARGAIKTNYKFTTLNGSNFFNFVWG